MDYVLTTEEQNAILDYEEFMRTGEKNKKISIVYFRGTDLLNHERAIHIMRYIFTKILRWTPEDVLNKASKKMITDLQLTIPYSKLIYPPELSKKRDYYYMAKLLFPEEIHSFSKSDITIHLYQQVLARSTTFPANYFSDPKNGLYNATMCLRYRLSHEVKFRNIEEMYEFFADQKKAMKYLKECKLDKPCELLFNGNTLDYMDYSIPKQQLDSLLYFNLRFHQVFDDSETGKLWNKAVTVSDGKAVADMDGYLDCLTMMEEDVPNILKSYIPTEEDLKRMNEEAIKYLPFMNYYVVANRDGIDFTDEDKELLKSAESRIDNIVKNVLSLKEE